VTSWGTDRCTAWAPATAAVLPSTPGGPPEAGLHFVVVWFCCRQIARCCCVRSICQNRKGMLCMQGAPKISKKTKAEAQGLSEAEQIAMQVTQETAAASMPQSATCQHAGRPLLHTVQTAPCCCFRHALLCAGPHVCGGACPQRPVRKRDPTVLSGIVTGRLPHKLMHRWFGLQPDRLHCATLMLTGCLAGPMQLRHAARSPQQPPTAAGAAAARRGGPRASPPAPHDAEPQPQRKRLHRGASAAAGSHRLAAVPAAARGRSLEFATAPQPGRSGFASASAAGAPPSLLAEPACVPLACRCAQRQPLHLSAGR
jgi:hypothetical protein